MRILFGEVPPEFFIEVVLRAVVIFCLLIGSMRLFGKRMAAQIDRVEMVSLFTLAAAIGVPMQVPDRGLVPPFIIAAIVVIIGRLVSRINFRNERAEARVGDRLTILANDGVYDLKKIRGTRLTLERLAAQLRSSGIRHLGEVKRLYVEANGSFSLVREAHPGCGLSVLPPHDRAFFDEQPKCAEEVCCTCGQQKSRNEGKDTCTNCGHTQWEPAIR